MNIQCNVCEKAEATVMCIADEAALCCSCDEKIHTVNKLSRKHLRVSLSNSSSTTPKCDICRETNGYFFCLEDRALLCGKCDISIHTANPLVSVHQRFLITGVKAGLEPKESVPSQAMLSSVEAGGEDTSKSLSKRGNSMSPSGNANNAMPGQANGDGGLTLSKAPFFRASEPGNIPEWPLEDFLGLTNLSQNYGSMEQESSKINSMEPEDTECSPIQRAAIEDAGINEYMAQVPEIPWSAPKIPSPPTSSGLYWPKKNQGKYSIDDSIFVPDISHLANGHATLRHGENPKRPRSRGG